MRRAHELACVIGQLISGSLGSLVIQITRFISSDPGDSPRKLLKFRCEMLQSEVIQTV